jgi:hypothetical protein
MARVRPHPSSSAKADDPVFRGVGYGTWRRGAHRASWWETLRSPQEKMPQREACRAGGYIATRLADGRSVRFKRVK